jgi:hypothetical protein
MNDNLAAYKSWAPDNTLWAAWAKPVLFVNPAYGGAEMEIPAADWLEETSGETMIILDLPGKNGIEEGLALALAGYRPVPLYNGVNGPNPESMIVNVSDIVISLYQGAEILKSINLGADAPPVFLLDFNRMNGKGKQRGKYDNRWCVFPQDMPSASFLAEHGIKKIILRAKDGKIQDDLSHILCRYQKQGIKIYMFEQTLKEIKVSTPPWFGCLLCRFGVILWLCRNSTGGFGAKIPEQKQYSGRVRGAYYYRMG